MKVKSMSIQEIIAIIQADVDERKRLAEKMDIETNEETEGVKSDE